MNQLKAVRARDFALLVVAWFLYAVISRPSEYVHHDTTEIMMWSQVGWPLGYFKHPPFLPWLFRIVFSVLPLREETVALISALNITVGAWAVWRIARLVTNERSAAIAVLLYCLCPYGTFLSLKINHNSILISLWPLTILFFLRTIRDRTLASGLLFGAFAAVSVLAKYYSFLMLSGCLIASWISLQRSAYYRTAAPYAAVALFAALLAPHFWWVVTSGMGTFVHAFLKATDPGWRALRFAVGGPLILLPAVLGYGGMRWLLRRHAASGTPRLLFGPELAVITVVPFVMTVVLTVALQLRTSTNWAIPIFSLVPVLLASRIPVPDLPDLRRIRRFAIAGLVGLVALSPAAYLSSFVFGGADFVEPRAEVGVHVSAAWEQAFGRPLKIVAGDRELATATSFEAASHPTEWTAFSFDLAPWLSQRDVDRDGLAVVCRAEDAGCAARGRGMMLAASGFSCGISRRRSIGAMSGPLLKVTAFMVAPAGARTAQPSCEVKGSASVAELREVAPPAGTEPPGWALAH